MILVAKLRSICPGYSRGINAFRVRLLSVGVCLLFSATTLAAELPRNTFGFTSTRIIFNEKGNKGSSVSFVNNTNKTYLVAPAVYEADKNGNKSDVRSPAFVVSPFLKKSQPFSEDVLKIVRTGGRLPDDTESLFYLSSVLIPSRTSSVPERIAVDVGYRWNMKILYRPLSLKDENISKSLEKLKVLKEGNRIKLINNSPLWMTVVNVKVNDSTVNEGAAIMISPHSSALLNETAVSATSVSLQLVDESGHRIPRYGKRFTFDA